MPNVNEPFAKYKNFNACLADMKSQGHDDESAKKICGAMQAKMEHKYDSKGRLIVAENVKIVFVGGVESIDATD